jgi:hypothetical protein
MDCHDRTNRGEACSRWLAVQLSRLNRLTNWGPFNTLQRAVARRRSTLNG